MIERVEAACERSVLITGTSTGIGYAAAVLLDRHGWRVFAGVRREDDERKLRAALSPRSRPIRLDVTVAADIAAAREIVDAACGGRLDALVNNAGIVTVGPIEVLRPEVMRYEYEVNLFGALDLTRAMLPLLRASRGRILMVGSVSGRSTWPYNGTYSSSKAALEMLTNTLRIELHPFGIPVVMIEPGVFKTAIWDKPAAPELRDFSALEPEVEQRYRAIAKVVDRAMHEVGKRAPDPGPVAHAILEALESPVPRYRYTIGADALPQLLMERLIPLSVRTPILAALSNLFATWFRR